MNNPLSDTTSLSQKSPRTLSRLRIDLNLCAIDQEPSKKLSSSAKAHKKMFEIPKRTSISNLKKTSAKLPGAKAISPIHSTSLYQNARKQETLVAEVSSTSADKVKQKLVREKRPSYLVRGLFNLTKGEGCAKDIIGNNTFASKCKSQFVDGSGATQGDQKAKVPSKKSFKRPTVTISLDIDPKPTSENLNTGLSEGASDLLKYLDDCQNIATSQKTDSEKSAEPEETCDSLEGSKVIQAGVLSQALISAYDSAADHMNSRDNLTGIEVDSCHSKSSHTLPQSHQDKSRNKNLLSFDTRESLQCNSVKNWHTFSNFAKKKHLTETADMPKSIQDLDRECKEIEDQLNTSDQINTTAHSYFSSPSQKPRKNFSSQFARNREPNLSSLSSINSKPLFTRSRNLAPSNNDDTRLSNITDIHKNIIKKQQTMIKELQAEVKAFAKENRELTRNIIALKASQKKSVKQAAFR